MWIWTDDPIYCFLVCFPEAKVCFYLSFSLSPSIFLAVRHYQQTTSMSPQARPFFFPEWPYGLSLSRAVCSRLLHLNTITVNTVMRHFTRQWRQVLLTAFSLLNIFVKMNSIITGLSWNGSMVDLKWEKSCTVELFYVCLSVYIEIICYKLFIILILHATWHPKPLNQFANHPHSHSFVTNWKVVFTLKGLNF